MRKLISLVLLACAGVTLAGCYLPARFDAEIELARNGFYKMTFEGFVVDLNLYEQIRQKKLKPGEDKPKIQRIITDFKRDKDTQEISYFGQGAFKVKWVKSGDILRSRMVTFFRRNENMVSISYNKNTGRITLRTRYVKKSDADRLTAIGLSMQGELRIKTDARVLSHNADKTKKEDLTTTYSWNVKSFYQPAPKMIVAFP